MAIFEKDKEEEEVREYEVREYMVILDRKGNAMGIFSPFNKKIPLQSFVDAFAEKCIQTEIIRVPSEIEIDTILLSPDPISF